MNDKDHVRVTLLPIKEEPVDAVPVHMINNTDNLRPNGTKRILAGGSSRAREEEGASMFLPSDDPELERVRTEGVDLIFAMIKKILAVIVKKEFNEKQSDVEPKLMEATLPAPGEVLLLGPPKGSKVKTKVEKEFFFSLTLPNEYEIYAVNIDRLIIKDSKKEPSVKELSRYSFYERLCGWRLVQRLRVCGRDDKYYFHHNMQFRSVVEVVKFVVFNIYPVSASAKKKSKEGYLVGSRGRRRERGRRTEIQEPRNIEQNFGNDSEATNSDDDASNQRSYGIYMPRAHTEENRNFVQPKQDTSTPLIHAPATREVVDVDSLDSSNTRDVPIQFALDIPAKVPGHGCVETKTHPLAMGEVPTIPMAVALGRANQVQEIHSQVIVAENQILTRTHVEVAPEAAGTSQVADQPAPMQPVLANNVDEQLSNIIDANDHVDDIFEGLDNIIVSTPDDLLAVEVLTNFNRKD